MRLKFHPKALEEYEHAVAYYEDRLPGLGERFIAAVEAALQGIIEAPQRWPELKPGVRRRLTRIFPYAILYSVELEYLLELAIMHCHQKPGYWHSRAHTGSR